MIKARLFALFLFLVPGSLRQQQRVYFHREVRHLASALSAPAWLTVPNNIAGIRTLQTQEGRDVFFNDGKILEHNALKIEPVCLVFILGTLLL